MPIDPRIARAISGDRQAAGALCAELLPRIRNLARYLLGRDQDVDDVAQNALLEILRSLPSYRAEAPLHAWADRITARTALGFARKTRLDRARAEPIGELRSVPPPDAPPDPYTTRREAVAMLDLLPVEQRDVVVLHHVADLSMPEVAEQLGIPFETARSRLRLGMARLREAMGGAAR